MNQFKIGDRVEYRDPNAWDRRYYGEPAEVIGHCADGGMRIRFEDGHEVVTYFRRLAWIPSVAEMEAAAAAIRRENIANLPNRPVPIGRPKKIENRQTRRGKNFRE